MLLDIHHKYIFYLCGKAGRMLERSPMRSIRVPSLEKAVIDTVRADGEASRKHLADQLNVSRSSVSKAVLSLQKNGILQRDEDLGSSSGGRRPGLLGINPRFGYIIGIHMGAMGTNLCLANFSGEIIAEERHELRLRNGSPAEIMDTLLDCAKSLLSVHGVDIAQILGIGISVPAPIDHETGNVVSPATMIGWESLNIPAYCRSHFPNAIVEIDNDVNALARGEMLAGLGVDQENFLFVKVGTGVGASVVINSQIYRGSTGISGHIGHVSIDRDGPVCHCGNVGCLERYVAGPALAQLGIDAAQNAESPLLEAWLEARGVLTAEDIGAAAAQGDRVANDIITHSGTTIGRVLATLVSCFNPSLVVIGGGVSNIGPQFTVSIHRAVLEYSLPLSTQHLTIAKSELGYRAGALGTVALVLDSLFITENV